MRVRHGFDARRWYAAVGGKETVGKGTRVLALAVALGGCTSTLEPGELPFAGGARVDVGGHTVVGSAPGENAGAALAFVERAGHQWLAVGAPFRDGRGAVYWIDADGVGAVESLATAVRWDGVGDRDAAGSAVGSPGDLDGDGEADLAVGAWRRDHRLGEDGGAVYVTFAPERGGALEDADVVIEGGPGDAIGFVLAQRRLDMNADGQADLVLSGFHASAPGMPSAGALYVFHGPLRRGRYAVGQADAILWGAAMADHAGLAWGPAGDVDGDGFEDLLVGAPLRDDGVGAAFLARGPFEGERWLTEEELVWVGSAEGELAGSALAALPGPAGTDLLIASPGGAGRLGRVVRVRGDEAQATMRSDDEVDGFGLGLSVPGDLDGDGFADVLASAPGASGAGRVYLVSGRTWADARSVADADAWLEGVAPGDALGTAAAWADGAAAVGARGHGRGTMRLALGAPGDDEGATNAGAVFLLDDVEEMR